jgi:hypothetical protein
MPNKNVTDGYGSLIAKSRPLPENTSTSNPQETTIHATFIDILVFHWAPL